MEPASSHGGAAVWQDGLGITPPRRGLLVRRPESCAAHKGSCQGATNDARVRVSPFDLPHAWQRTARARRIAADRRNHCFPKRVEECCEGREDKPSRMDAGRQVTSPTRSLQEEL